MFYSFGVVAGCAHIGPVNSGIKVFKRKPQIKVSQKIFVLYNRQKVSDLADNYIGINFTISKLIKQQGAKCIKNNQTLWNLD